MTKFKVGDKVVLNQDCGIYRSGDIFTVTRASDVEPGYWNGYATQIVSTNGVECFDWRFDPVKSVKSIKQEEEKMDSPFVETVTTTKIKEVVDYTDTKDMSAISVKQCSPSHIQLIVGAKQKDNYCANFSKKGVAELIENLQSIHDAMGD